MQFQKIVFISAVVIAFFAALWLVICTLLEQRIPNTLQPADDYIFDYVVVGAGTAGSVVAALLSKHSDDTTVLLIEAGDKFGLLSKIPLLATFQQKGLNDWAFLSVPQRHSSKGLEEQRQCLPRGKGLGGSAQLNYMLHFDGQPADFDAWALDYNLSDWHWAAFRPYLEAGRAQPHEMLEIHPQYSKLTEAFYHAETEFVHKPWTFRRARYNIKNGLRYNVFQRFLQPVLKNRNLRILNNAMVKRIQLADDENGNKKAQSVLVGIKDEYTRKEQLFNVDIRRELILCAGAYQSPQLLQVSGIGDSTNLERLKIPLQHELPKVGQNLHDHLNQALFVSIDAVGPTINQRTFLNPLNLLNYLSAGSGPYGNFGVFAHIDSSYEESFGLTFFGVGAIDENALMSISNFKREHFRALFPRYHNATQEGFVLISTCVQPKSRGTVSVGNANMRRNPLIDPNYLSESADIDCTVNAIRAAVQVLSSEAFSVLRPRIHWPKIRECSNFGPFERDFHLNEPSARYLECVIRHVGLGSHHPAGTCSMGTSKENSVVDAYFRMHGVPNLRIIDASVLPKPISGNPNSIIVGMAVRGATMLLKAQLERDTEEQ